MALPQVDHVDFARAPITKVVAQVRFPILLRFAEPSFVAPLQDAIHDEYPTPTREKKVSLRIADGEALQAGPSETLIRFSTKDKRWSVVIAESAMTLEVAGSTSIDELVTRFTHVLTATQETLGIEDRARLGLRYINKIRHPDAAALPDWAALLRPEFLGFAASDLLDGQVDHMAQELRIKRDDGVLVIRHGLFDEADIEPTVVPQPTGRYYLIDLDYFDSTDRPLDVDITVQQIKKYNHFMYRFFRWTLGEELYAYLEPSPAS